MSDPSSPLLFFTSFFGFGATPCGAQGLLLVLHSQTTPGRPRGPYEMLGIEPCQLHAIQALSLLDYGCSPSVN